MKKVDEFLEYHLQLTWIQETSRMVPRDDRHVPRDLERATYCGVVIII